MTTDQLYSAAQSGDLSAAIKVCAPGVSDGSWIALVLETVKRLESDWVEDRSSIGEIVNAFWVLRRVIDDLGAPRSQALSSRMTLGLGLVCAAPAELHTFGAQLLTDRLIREGWRAELLLSQSERHLCDFVSRQYVNFVGISVGSDQAMAGLLELIASLRQASLNSQLEVVLGGAAFNGDLNQYAFLGSDFIASSAEDAIVHLSKTVARSVRIEGGGNG